MDESFTPKQVAQALQVSESSVKRWCDRGVIRSDRTLGGHRRIPLEHLLAFLESTNRRVIDPSAIGLLSRGGFGLSNHFSGATPRRETDQNNGEEKSSERSTGVDDADSAEKEEMRREFERAVVTGNEMEARKQISRWFATRGGMVTVADELIAPTFQVVGRLWECGDIDVYQERRGCELCVRLIHELRRLLPEPLSSAPLAMGGTASGDQYQLPNQLIEMVFRQEGWRSVNLGCDLPFSSLLSAARKHMPRIFWLSVSYVRDESIFISECEHFSGQLPKGILFVIGGRALHEGLRRKLSYSSYCDNMQQLSGLARSIRSALPPSSPLI